MKAIIDLIEAKPVLGAAALSTLPLVFPKVRAWIKRMWASRGKDRREFHEKLDGIKSDVKAIKDEVEFFPGTSTKQEVSLLKKRAHQDFWRATKPSIEMDGDAMVDHVSETLCRLMGVFTPADLHLRNWLRCVESSRVDDFLTAFTESVRFKSDFDFVFSVQTKSGTDQGKWKLTMSDVTPSGYSKTIYTGYFKPVNDRAREVAESLHWSK